jgi:recombination protein RecA
LVQLWRNQIRTSRDAVKSLIKDNPELADELEEKIKARIKELAEA